MEYKITDIKNERLKNLEQSYYGLAHEIKLLFEERDKGVERLKKLEEDNNYIKECLKSINGVQPEINLILQEKIAKQENLMTNVLQDFEKRINTIAKALDNWREYRTDIDDSMTDIMYLKQRVEKLESALNSSQQNSVTGSAQKIPSICKICEPGLMNEALAQIQIKEISQGKREKLECHACQGKGIVWSE